MRLFFLLIILFGQNTFGTEVEALKKEEEARSLRRQGRISEALELEKQAENLRIVPISQIETPSFPSLTKNWNIGVALQSNQAIDSGGQNWFTNVPNVWFQSGSPYHPRFPFAYQNKSDLPISWIKPEPGANGAFVPVISYRSQDQKWGIRYRTTRYQTDFFGVTSSSGGVVGREAIRFGYQDHKLHLEIHEILSSDWRVSWNFGLRYAQWDTGFNKTNTEFNRGSFGLETSRYLAPQLGFIFHYNLSSNLSLFFGGDLFFSTLGQLQYRSDLIEASGFSRTSSREPLALNAYGLDIRTGLEVPIGSDKLFFIWESNSTIWRANESHYPNFFASSEDSYRKSISEYYRSSAIYESDGSKKVLSRSFGIGTIMLGYSHAI